MVEAATDDTCHARVHKALAGIEATTALTLFEQPSRSGRGLERGGRKPAAP